MMEPDTKILDIKTCGKTLSEVLDIVADYKTSHPGYEVFLDGDAYAIVARRRVCA